MPLDDSIALSATQPPPSLEIGGDPAAIISELLDGLFALGEMARQISIALGRNGHRQTKLAWS